MENFRTILKLPPSPLQLHLHTPILTVGSCFADSIGKLLSTYKFNTLSNPFDTVYNPLSIHRLIYYTLENKLLENNSYQKLNNVFFHYDFHSAFSSLNKHQLKKNINDSLNTTHQFIKNVDTILITYGTAWVYQHKERKMVVSNCHKVHQKNFKKSLLTPEEIVASFKTLYKKIKKVNPKVKIILTVSPVRHLKDTLELNSVSKSILRLSCHMLEEYYSSVFYFPAYEIVLDDLRDYRFYNNDMIHPSPQTVEYIWRYFATCYFSSSTQQFIKQWKDIMKAIAHVPLHTSSPSHQIFLKNTLQKLNLLKEKIAVNKEIALLQEQIIH